MKAMIMAAGLGTRLGKITSDKPKALVEINGKSLLHLAVEKCALSGFDDIIVNVHHFAGKVEEEIKLLRQKGFRITVSDEREKLMDTGGGLFKARSFFDSNPFLLYNTDIVTDLDLKSLYSFHLETGSIATLAVRNRKGNRYLLVDSTGRLRGWCNRVTNERIVSGTFSGNLTEIAFSAIHVIDPAIFNFMYDGIYSMTALYLQLAAENQISTYRDDEGFWFDIGTPESLENVQRYFSGLKKEK